jgi:hypothetical protein
VHRIFENPKFVQSLCVRRTRRWPERSAAALPQKRVVRLVENEQELSDAGSTETLR